MSSGLPRQIGNYELVHHLGTGGFASVWRARHSMLGSEHAVKILRNEWLDSEQVRARFLSEGQIQARTRHPNIVQVTETLSDNAIGLVMEYVDGGSLEDLLYDRDGPLDYEEIGTIFLPVLDAVHFAHERGIVHRDLKPPNILLDRSGRAVVPKVADFGIAKITDEAESLDGAGRTRMSNLAFGTYAYMSPEQIKSTKHVDRRSDVFALGAILFEMLTGEHAFADESDYETQRKIVEGYRHPNLNSMRGPLAAVVRRALETEPADRYQTCSEMYDALEAALGNAQRKPSAPRPAVRKDSVPPPVREEAVESPVDSDGSEGEVVIQPRPGFLGIPLAMWPCMVAWVVGAFLLTDRSTEAEVAWFGLFLVGVWAAADRNGGVPFDGPFPTIARARALAIVPLAMIPGAAFSGHSWNGTDQSEIYTLGMVPVVALLTYGLTRRATRGGFANRVFALLMGLFQGGLLLAGSLAAGYFR